MSAISRLNRILKAYNENPVENITATLITIDKLLQAFGMSQNERD